MSTSISNKATTLIRAANAQAKGLEQTTSTGVSQIDIQSAKNTLALLQKAKPGTSGQKGALTRALNRLEQAVDGAKVNPQVRDVGGATASKVSDATLKRFSDATMKALSGGKLNFNLQSLPVGPRTTEARLFAEKHPDGFTYTAVIQTGALRPGAPQKDPNTATSIFIKRTGGIAGMTTFAGPLDVGAASTGPVIGRR